MMLYRPFLHYVSHTCKSRVIDKRSYACAAACVSVSRNIVHIACEMRRKGLLAGAYWFTMYTTFFAILSLVFYALENPDNDASRDVLRVATEGVETLRKLTKQSMAADRCSATLQVGSTGCAQRSALTDDRHCLSNYQIACDNRARLPLSPKRESNRHRRTLRPTMAIQKCKISNHHPVPAPFRTSVRKAKISRWRT